MQRGIAYLHVTGDLRLNMIFIDKLEAAQERRPPRPEIVLCSAASLRASESQTPECSDLLSRSRCPFLSEHQRQPGKLREAKGNFAEAPSRLNRM